MKCPTCHSPAPHLHPAVQHEGEVELCRDTWHKPSIAEIDAANAARRLDGARVVPPLEVK